MNFITSKPFLLVRKFGRILGINSYIANLLYGKGYEMKYDRSLQNKIKKGYIVWDVGSNIGHYTKIFSDLVGPEGTILAFEPSPINFSKLVLATQNLSNVKLFNFGLGNIKSNVLFKQGDDNIGATSRIISGSENILSSLSVPIMVPDEFIIENEFSCPDVVKIDVEGYELEVVQGLKKTLTKNKISVIGIEVHFKILEERSLNDAPRIIENILIESGFKINWTDSSHLIACRV